MQQLILLLLLHDPQEKIINIFYEWQHEVCTEKNRLYVHVDYDEPLWQTML